MNRNLILFSGLALLAAAVCSAQTPIPLNVLPSRIVGHPNPESTQISSANPNLVEGRELYSPEGIALDTTVTPPILYVADTGNNRVLAWKNAASFNNGQKADLVIGQQDFFSTYPQGPSGGGNHYEGLAAPEGLAVDGNGNLYVADALNNRILRYPKPFAQTGSIQPDLWLGQPGITSRAANYTGGISAQGLNLAGSPYPINVALDSQGNLWVVDGANRRVLRFNASDLASASTANGGSGGAVNASLVLGQVDMQSNNQPGPSAGNRTLPNAFATPVALAFDAAGNLYVSDASSNDLGSGVSRVLVFKAPFANGASAARIMGVWSNTQTQSAIDATAMAVPGAIFFIPSAGKMGVLDTFSSRILVFDTLDKWPDPTTSVSPLANTAYGQQDCHSRAANQGSLHLQAPTEATLNKPLAAVFSGSELFVADTGNSRVIVLSPLSATGNCSQAPATTFNAASRVLGQDTSRMWSPNLIEGREFDFSNNTAQGTAYDAGIAIDTGSDTPHLYVADTYNNRILGYKDFRSLAAGDKADIVIGQPDFNSGLPNITGDPATPTAASLYYPIGLAVDGSGNLYVADLGNSRVLRFPAPFASQGAPQRADLVLGQRQFTGSIPGCDSATMKQPYGLALAANNGLLVSDLADNRVLYFAFTGNGTFSAGTDNGRPADKVFGQPDFGSSGCTAGKGIAQLSAPRHIATDNEARLYVADAANGRVTIFDHIGSPATPATGASRAFEIAIAGPRSVWVNQLTSEIWVGDGSTTVKQYPYYANLILQNPVAAVNSVGAPGGLAIAQDEYGDMAIADATNRVGFFFPAVQGLNGGNQLLTRPLAPGVFAILCSPGSACDPNKRRPLFGPTTAANTDLPNPYPMPTTLGDVQVLFNGTPTPLYYVSPSQINFVVPMNAPQSGTADITVVQASTGRVYAAGIVSMAPVSPAILMSEYTGTLRQAAVVNLADGSVNSTTNPAARGSYISIYATGQGFVPGAPPDGTVPPGAVAASQTMLKVNIAGNYLDTMFYDPSSDSVPRDQWVQYSGLSSFPGLWQINIYIPHAVIPGTRIPLIITANGTPSVDTGTFVTYINVK